MLGATSGPPGRRKAIHTVVLRTTTTRNAMSRRRLRRLGREGRFLTIAPAPRSRIQQRRWATAPATKQARGGGAAPVGLHDTSERDDDFEDPEFPRSRRTRMPCAGHVARAPRSIPIFTGHRVNVTREHRRRERLVYLRSSSSRSPASGRCHSPLPRGASSWISIGATARPRYSAATAHRSRPWTVRYNR